MSVSILVGDCRGVLPTLAADSIDSCVTDPPYGLGFMGKDWDHGIPGVHFWQEVLRVLKPGAHLVAFGGTRTHHRLMCAIEDAGFEIRDCLGWLYGSGFPKSHNVGNAIDKAHGCDNRGHAIASGSKFHPTTGKARAPGDDLPAYEARTEAGKPWQGWGTALKPAWEPIILARKPLAGTVAANVQEHGTGALNIDACRIAGEKGSGVWGSSNKDCQDGRMFNASPDGEGYRSEANDHGRWPANICHDGSEEVLAVFPDEAGAFAPVRGTEPSRPAKNTYGEYARGGGAFHGDSGSAARFFYCAKASRKDRNEGLHGLGRKPMNWSSGEQSPGTFQSPNTDRSSENHHPTVKPTDLMRWLCRLVTPPGGIVLDPFMGSGSTGKAAQIEGFEFIGIELEAEYAEIAKARIRGESPLFSQVTQNHG